MENYVVVDLEMTGMNLKKDCIIEIGALRIQGNKVDSFSSLIRPNIQIPEKIQVLTGITDEMVKEAKSDTEVMEEFFAFAGEYPLVGHRVIGDYGFLKQWAVNHGMKYERDGVDTLKIARKYLPASEKKTLDSLCEYYHISMEHHHRALDDAKATHELFLRLKEAFEKNNCDDFKPKALQCKVKKIRPATSRQKTYLKELMEYHQIEADVCWEQLTQSEASKMTDKIILSKGRPNDVVRMTSKED